MREGGSQGGGFTAEGAESAEREEDYEEKGEVSPQRAQRARRREEDYEEKGEVSPQRAQ